jgi:hypothetical protein
MMMILIDTYDYKSVKLESTLYESCFQLLLCIIWMVFVLQRVQ